jgi:hypothetical protein
VQAIIPRKVIDPAEQTGVFTALGIQPNECVYCGRTATDQDHFRAIVRKGRPSGYFHDITNLVPACGPCNQSKGGADWKAWMLGSARHSPASRGIKDLDERVARLERFERYWGDATAVSETEMAAAVGIERWNSYWVLLAQIADLMKAAQGQAEEIREKLATH